MFTDATARRAIAAIQGEIADLGALVAVSNERIAALAERLAALADEVARLGEREGRRDGALDALSERIGAGDAATERQESLLREQGGRLDDVERAADSRHQELERLVVEVDRMGRQATLDNKEMRGNYTALAQLAARGRQAVP